MCGEVPQGQVRVLAGGEKTAAIDVKGDRENGGVRFVALAVEDAGPIVAAREISV